MTTKEHRPTALEILEEFADEDDVPMQDVKKQLLAFIREMEKKHEPLTGEAYPEDRNRYCAVCMSADGGSSRHPCGTIRAIRKYLGQKGGKR
jgi:hypothetical protein